MTLESHNERPVAVDNPIDKTAKIRALNDAFRTGESDDGMVVITAGIRGLGSDFLA